MDDPVRARLEGHRDEARGIVADVETLIEEARLAGLPVEKLEQNLLLQRQLLADIEAML